MKLLLERGSKQIVVLLVRGCSQTAGYPNVGAADHALRSNTSGTGPPNSDHSLCPSPSKGRSTGESGRSARFQRRIAYSGAYRCLPTFRTTTATKFNRTAISIPPNTSQRWYRSNFSSESKQSKGPRVIPKYGLFWQSFNFKQKHEHGTAEYQGREERWGSVEAQLYPTRWWNVH